MRYAIPSPPVYDVNPVPDGEGLKLNITETDNSQNLDTARAVIGYFRISQARAEKIIKEVKSAVLEWRAHAKALGIPASQQDHMSRAFRVAERN